MRKRDAFREVFKYFDPERMARFGEADIVKPLANAGIGHSRARNEAAVNKAYGALANGGKDNGAPGLRP